MFQLVACNLAVLAIALIFYAWRDSRLAGSLRRSTLNERVAYMLWVTAHRVA